MPVEKVEALCQTFSSWLFFPMKEKVTVKPPPLHSSSHYRM